MLIENDSVNSNSPNVNVSGRTARLNQLSLAALAEKAKQNSQESYDGEDDDEETITSNSEVAQRGEYRHPSATSAYMDDDFRSVVRDMQGDNDSHKRHSNPRKLEWSLRSLRRNFLAKNTEEYFKRYQQRLSHRFFTVLLILNICVCLIDTVWYICERESHKFPFPALTRLSSMAVYAVFLVKCWRDEKWLLAKMAKFVSSVVVILTMLYSEYSGIFIALTSSEKDTFNWKRARPIFYLIMCNQILLPFPSRLYSSLASMVVVIIEVAITLAWPHISDHSCREMTPSFTDIEWNTLNNWYVFFISDILFYCLAFFVSFYVTYLFEIVNRRAFLDHRKCVESKYSLTFERDEQERLLSSCLPRHLMQMVHDDIHSRFAFHINESNDRSRNVVDSNNNVKRGSNGSISRPFKELYINKHENVTILYADIVNSMLLTESLKSPKALIETLNDLFGRFDHQAEVHNCLRIKLLGDCYYCVSGIPDCDQQHALNSLRMGLDMIEIIKNFRDKNNIQINMRIGVHTGMILSGLLGLKKWQYDIWSIDAMKASQMEHDGQPGSVHATRVTLDLIPQEVLEQLIISENHVIPDETTYLIQRNPTYATKISLAPSFCGQSDNAKKQIVLRKANTVLNIEPLHREHQVIPEDETMSIVSVNSNQTIQSVTSTTTQAIVCASLSASSSNASSVASIVLRMNSQSMKRSSSQTNLPKITGLANRDSSQATPRFSNSYLTERRRTVVLEPSVHQYRSIIRSSNDSLSKTIDEMPFNLKEQYNYTNHSMEIHPVFMYFIDRRKLKSEDIESSRDPSVSYCDIKPQIRGKLRKFWQFFYDAHRIDFTKESSYFRQADPLYPYYLLVSLVITLAIIGIRFLTMYDSQYVLDFNFWYETGNIACYCALVIILSTLMLTFGLKMSFNTTVRVIIWLSITFFLVTSTIIDMSHCPISETQEAEIEKFDKSTGKECLYKWSRYYTYSCILAMSSISLFIRINLWIKFCLSTCALIAITVTNHVSSCSIFSHVDRFYSNNGIVEVEYFTPTESHIQYLFIIYLLFHSIDRQIEYISRLDFLWASKLKQEEQQAKGMREVNQLLLKNILPIHLAIKFLNNPEQRHSLYYEPYESCAVMFAALPNFFKFYTENKDNDDGLQYISVLNDIICDFDKLLMLPDYKDKIEKIKTIGSTYMAASGLHPGRASIDSSVTIEEETKNLANLIRFAMSMIKVLNRLNTVPKIREVMEMKKKSAHFKLRVGISMGPVIAGVVGAIKPQYDIWGDTVNVASRMDTNGICNKIHLPSSVAKQLCDNNLFRPYSRGIQNIKGKGKLETYLIDYDPNECPD